MNQLIQNDNKHTQGIKLTQPRETFSFKPYIIPGLDPKWLIPSKSLETFISIFNITKKVKEF